MHLFPWLTLIGILCECVYVWLPQRGPHQLPNVEQKLFGHLFHETNVGLIVHLRSPFSYLCFSNKTFTKGRGHQRDIEGSCFI